MRQSAHVAFTCEKTLPNPRSPEPGAPQHRSLLTESAGPFSLVFAASDVYPYFAWLAVWASLSLDLLEFLAPPSLLLTEALIA